MRECKNCKYKFSLIELYKTLLFKNIICSKCKAENKLDSISYFSLFALTIFFAFSFMYFKNNYLVYLIFCFVTLLIIAPFTVKYK